MATFRVESQQAALIATHAARRVPVWAGARVAARNLHSLRDVLADSPFRVRSWVARAAACVALAAPAAAYACPACPVGREARQQVYERDFTRNLLVALLPFAMVGFASVCAERVGKGRKPSSGTGESS